MRSGLNIEKMIPEMGIYNLEGGGGYEKKIMEKKRRVWEILFWIIKLKTIGVGADYEISLAKT